MQKMTKMATLVAFVLLVSCNNGNTYNPEKIKKEVSSKFNAFNGTGITLEQWDTYFMKSPNIGDIADGKPKVGWQTIHDRMAPAADMMKDIKVEVVDIIVYPIDERTAWAQGKLTFSRDTLSRTSEFYDALIKTGGEWKVFMSYVKSE